MKALGAIATMAALALPGQVVQADDLTGSSRILCAAVQATVCFADGDCTVDLPWNLSIPEFIEVDLEARTLSTTAASGLDRSTPIEHLSRQDGTLVLQGFQMCRAFSFIITEDTGQATIAVAIEGLAVSVFGACTPLPAVPSRADR